MNNKYSKIIFEFNNLNYKDFNNKNIKNYTSEQVFCAFYSDLIFHLKSTGFFFVISHNCLNKSKDSDKVINDIHLLDFFIEATININKKINSKNLEFFIKFLNSIYNINIESFINNKDINKEMDKFLGIEEEFFKKYNCIEKDVALFLCKHYYNEEFRKIFPEFKTILKVNNF